MNIYLVDLGKEKYSSKVSNGAQGNVKLVGEVGEKEMLEICKGGKSHIIIKFFKRGFFGGLTLTDEGQI